MSSKLDIYKMIKIAQAEIADRGINGATIEWDIAYWSSLYRQSEVGGDEWVIFREHCEVSVARATARMLVR